MAMLPTTLGSAIDRVIVHAPCLGVAAKTGDWLSPRFQTAREGGRYQGVHLWSGRRLESPRMIEKNRNRGNRTLTADAAPGTNAGIDRHYPSRLAIDHIVGRTNRPWTGSSGSGCVVVTGAPWRLPSPYKCISFAAWQVLLAVAGSCLDVALCRDGMRCYRALCESRNILGPQTHAAALLCFLLKPLVRLTATCNDEVAALERRPCRTVLRPDASNCAGSSPHNAADLTRTEIRE